MKQLLIYLTLVLCLIISSLTTHAITSTEYCAVSQETEMVRLINEYRVQNGLGALRGDQILGAAARHHTIDMGQRNVLDHNMADGSSFADNIRAHGWVYSGYLAEVAAGSYSTAAEILNAWKYSPSHNAALLDPKYISIGVGYYDDGGVTQARYWWIADMASTSSGQNTRVCGGTTTPQPTNTKTNTPTATKTNTAVNTVTTVPTNTATSTVTNTVSAPTFTTVPTNTAVNTPIPTATPPVKVCHNTHSVHCR